MFRNGNCLKFVRVVVLKRVILCFYLPANFVSTSWRSQYWCSAFCYSLVLQCTSSYDHGLGFTLRQHIIIYNLCGLAINVFYFWRPSWLGHYNIYSYRALSRLANRPATTTVERALLQLYVFRRIASYSGKWRPSFRRSRIEKLVWWVVAYKW